MFFIADNSYFEIFLVSICETKLSFSFHNNILTDYTLGEKNKIKQIVKTDVIHFFFFINTNDLLHMVI